MSKKSSHPSDFVHCLLSAYVYEKNLIKLKSNNKSVEFTDAKKKYNKYLNNWKIWKVICESPSDYCAVIYVNEQSKQVVLAHGVTKDSPLKTWIDILKGQQILSEQVYKATKKAMEYVEAINKHKDNDYQLSTTGYSFGGLLACQTIYFCHAGFDYRDIKAVTFDSPGCDKTMEQFKSNIINKEVKTREELTNLDIVTYLYAPNFINSCNKHVGTVYSLFPEIPRPEFVDKAFNLVEGINKIKENEFVLDALLSIFGHKLDLILNEFDPNSGKPKNYQKVLDWPCIEYNSKNGSKSLVDKIPGAAIVKKPLSFAINALESTTIGAALLTLYDILNGDVNIDQYMDTYNHISKKNNEVVYNIEGQKVSDNDKFYLIFKGHYKIEKFDPYKDILSTERYFADYYLVQLNKYNEASLFEVLSHYPNTLDNLVRLKKAYKIYDKSGTISSDKYTIEELRNEITLVVKEHDKIQPTAKMSNLIGEKDSIHLEHNINIKIGNYLPEERLTNFVGREEEIKQIGDILGHVIIAAQPGCGKSTLALEYAYIQKEHDNKVFWLGSELEGKIVDNYSCLASALGINKILQDDRKALIMEVNKALENQNSKILLIFDNVEKYEDVKDYILNLPNNVQAVITTRNSKLTDKLQIFNLQPFNIEETKAYLKKSIKREINDNQLDNLIKKAELKDGAFPYILSKITAYFNEKREEKLDNLIDEYDHKKLMEYLVAAVNKESVEWQMLQYVSCIDPDFISFKLLKGILGVDKTQINKAIDRLENLSFVKFIHDKEGEPGINIHRLSQKAVRNYLSHDPRESTKYKVIISNLLKLVVRYFSAINSDSEIAMLMDKINDKKEKWKKAEQLIPHITQLIDEYKENPNILNDVADGINRIITYFYEQGDIQNNKKLLKYVYVLQKILKKISSHPNLTISMLVHLGNIWSDFKDKKIIKDGLNYLLKAENIASKFYPNHPDLSVIFNNIALTLRKLGGQENLKDAIKYLRKAVDLASKNAEDLAISAIPAYLNNLRDTEQELTKYIINDIV